MTMDESSWESLKALGFGELLQCVWGEVVKLEHGEERCGRQATSMVALHGTPLGDVMLKLCDEHRAIVNEQSTLRH